MFRKRNLSLAAAALAIASSSVLAQGRPLAIGQLDFGTIEEHATDVWTVEAERGQPIRFAAGSSDFDSLIEVRTPDGALLTNDDCSTETLDSCVDTTVPVGGRYELRVTALFGNGGQYWVTAESTERPALETLRPGRTVSAHLDGSGPTAGDGLWRFAGERGDDVVVSVMSDDFDPAVRLLDSSGTAVAHDDDGGHGLNARLTATLPTTGDYEIVVTAVSLLSNTTTGLYTIRLDVRNGAASSGEEEDVAEGRPIVGELEPNDTAYATREWYDEYMIDLEVGNSLVVDAESDEVQVYLVAISPSGVRSGYSSTARHGLNQVALQIDPGEPGTWRVHVTSATPAESGRYEVRLGARPAGPSVIRGTLEVGDEEGRDGGYVDAISIPAGMGCVSSLRLSGPAGLWMRLLGPAHHTDSDSVAASSGTVSLDNVVLDDQQVLVIGSPGQTGDYDVEIAGGCPEAARPAAAAGKTFGLFVGVSDYGGRTSNLPRTASDAQRLAATLVAAGVLPAENAVVLTDRQATVTGMEAAVAELEARVGPEDTFLFFFSGHGNQEQRDAPELTDPDGLDETIELVDGAVRDDKLHDLLTQIDAKLTLVVLDSCFSGGFAKDVIGVPGRLGIFSSEEDALSGMPAEAGGYLSSFMIDAVAGAADTDDDGTIRAIELRQYLHERYRAEVKTDARRIDEIVRALNPAYQHLSIDPGDIRQSDVLFRLTPAR